MLSRSYGQNDRDVIFENFVDETVLINLKSGIYYSLNAPGSAIWELLLKSVAPVQILEFVQKTHPENGRGYEGFFRNFITVLEAEGLIVPTGDGAQAGPEFAAAELDRLLGQKEKEPAVPEIKIYTDQKELLLLDPIHEASGLGWPDKDGKEPQNG